MSGARAPAADLMDVQLERRALATAIVNREAVARLASLPRDAFVGEHSAALRDAIVEHDSATPDGERLDGGFLASAFARIAHISEHDAMVKISDWVGPMGDSTLKPQFDPPKFQRACEQLAKLAQQRAAARELWRAVQAIENGTGTAQALENAKAALAGLDSEPATRGAIVVNLADVEPEPVRWLWAGRIPLGKLALFVGDPCTGKSCVSLAVAAAVTTGAPFGDGAIGCEAGNVILLSAEDALADTVRPRLDAAGADVRRVTALQAIRSGDGERGFDLTRDVRDLERAVAERGDVRLIIIDPISAYLGGTDSHNNADVRAVLTPLTALAERTGAAVLAVTHLNKGAGGKALYRATGSLAFVATARAAWLFAADPVDDSRRAMVSLKSNLGPETGGLAYRIVGDAGGSPVVEWLGVTDATAADVSAAEVASRRSATPGALDDCKAWLRDALAGRSEGWPSSELEEAARAEGYSSRTLIRARKALGVRTWKDGLAGGWRVSLPTGSAEECQPAPCGPGVGSLRGQPDGFPKIANPGTGRDGLAAFEPADDDDVMIGPELAPGTLEERFAEST